MVRPLTPSQIDKFIGGQTAPGTGTSLLRPRTVPAGIGPFLRMWIGHLGEGGNIDTDTTSAPCSTLLSAPLLRHVPLPLTSY